MHYLLDRVHTELLLSPKCYGTSETIITGIFGGLLHSEVRCLVCGTESKKYDPFLGECGVKYYCTEGSFLLQNPFCEYPLCINAGNFVPFLKRKRGSPFLWAVTLLPLFETWQHIHTQEPNVITGSI